MSALLSLEKVNSGYGRAQVLHDFSLKIGCQERVAILGRNGVGKTTVVNTCLGLANLHSGSVQMGGKQFRKLRSFNAAWSGVAVVPQGRRIVPTLSVRENLLLGAAVKRPGPWNVESVFNLFPILRERAETPGTAMSGGQQQMLAIGRALMTNPDLLILDEPSEGLAPVVVDALGVTLRKLADQGTSILLIEQNIRLVCAATDHYHVLSKGTITDSGSLKGITFESLHKHIMV
ncbi:ABC transporter ATP-binding protein [Paraburkholderia dipogonis]|uniref:ABC transporter ATP-binding protein n=1 Tax=Paraburkholderia dipogonis TaxID=1211383 RepID=A0A4Y8MGC1_9BURK|nr:ABC transporter ATP-binding protein [Paraburkholderia dipogonis]TFE36487.1 ABC transporter ATP-binding protein [Paraburkholderia dipogonis]